MASNRMEWRKVDISLGLPFDLLSNEVLEVVECETRRAVRHDLLPSPPSLLEKRLSGRTPTPTPLENRTRNPSKIPPFQIRSMFPNRS